MGAYHIPEKATQLRALYAWMWGWPGKKTLFMGSEFAQSAEWAYDKSLDWHLLQYMDHEGVRLLVRDLNRFFTAYLFLAAADHDPLSFQWVNNNDANNSVISFVRHGTKSEEVLLVVANLTPVPRPQYRVGVPREGSWTEVLNSNSKRYGGSGHGHLEPVKTQPIKWDGRPQALDLNLPGMAVLYFLLSPNPALALAPGEAKP
jgi:1,4-alpha-glucan branching enzyme